MEPDLQSCVALNETPEPVQLPLRGISTYKRDFQNYGVIDPPIPEQEIEPLQTVPFCGQSTYKVSLQ